MARNWWLVAAAAGLALSLGCSSSNPYRPTLFQRNKDKQAGPELGAPVEGPYSGDGMPITAAPPGTGTYPSGPVVIPPGGQPLAPGAPIPSFPQGVPQSPPATLPQGPPPVPQGPMPRPAAK